MGNLASQTSDVVFLLVGNFVPGRSHRQRHICASITIGNRKNIQRIDFCLVLAQPG